GLLYSWMIGSRKSMLILSVWGCSTYSKALSNLFFFFKQKTAYEIGLGIPAEPLFRSALSLSRNRRRLKANQTGKKFRVGIKSNISTNRNNLISGVDRCIHLNRSEERRVGKECRWRGSRYQ